MSSDCFSPQIQALFREEYGEVHIVSVPTRQERSDFFQDLLLNQAAEAPPSKPAGARRFNREGLRSVNKSDGVSDLTSFPPPAVAEAVEVLPLAPMPRPRQLPERERLRLEEQEEDVLRDLRLFLRYVTESLAQDRRFKAFAKPVDTEEVGGLQAASSSSCSSPSRPSSSSFASRSRCRTTLWW